MYARGKKKKKQTALWPHTSLLTCICDKMNDVYMYELNSYFSTTR